MAVRTNEILIGSKESPLLSLDNDTIISVNGNLACDLLCEEIPIDTLEIQCRYDLMNQAFAPSDYEGLSSGDGKILHSRSTVSEGDLQIPYATGLWYYNGGAYVGKFYVVDARRTGKTVYVIKAQSAMGVLDTLRYYGKLYVKASLKTVVQEILLTDGKNETETPFLTELADSVVLGDGLEDVNVTGWIPVCTKREALHHVLFAHGLNILKSENDAFLITRISDTIVGPIDQNNEYDDGSMDLTEPVKSVEVTEHSYVQQTDAEAVVLYDNTENPISTETVVLFDSAPIVKSSLTKTGTLKILSSNENFAIVSGVGILTGIPYAHTTRIVSRTNKSITDGQTITVSSATLINALNSDAVADRLYAYYTQKREMQVPIVLSGERCGSKYTFVSPFGEDSDGFISAMSINASAIAKADCTMVTGYTPSANSGEMTHMIALTGSGVFQTPAEVLESDNPRMRVVLIGGGQGGGDGRDGVIGSSDPINQPYDKYGCGGLHGRTGDPGKILVLQLDGDSVLSSYDYSCGAGGKHGREGEDEYLLTGEWGPYYGYPGEETTFGKYSSDSGTIPETAFMDVMTGNLYGGPSPDLTKLMKSGHGGSFHEYGHGFGTADGDEEMSSLEGEDGITHTYSEEGIAVANEQLAAETGRKVGSEIWPCDSGVSGEDGSLFDSLPDGVKVYHGQGGGGPIVRYGDTYRIPPAEYNGKKTVINTSAKTITYGDGGRGADGYDAPSPMSLSKTAYGQGGIGGQGGAGGGDSGWSAVKLYWTIIGGTPGEGGAGGKGSDGAPGIILVYY